jgi:hypothetical protein
VQSFPQLGVRADFLSSLIWNRLSGLIKFRDGSDKTSSVVQWSELLATDPEVRVRFPALPDFLKISGSGTGSTLPREYNSKYLKEKAAARVQKTESTSVRIRDADHVAPSIRKSWH